MSFNPIWIPHVWVRFLEHPILLSITANVTTARAHTAVPAVSQYCPRFYMLQWPQEPWPTAEGRCGGCLIHHQAAICDATLEGESHFLAALWPGIRPTEDPWVPLPTRAWPGSDNVTELEDSLTDGWPAEPLCSLLQRYIDLIYDRGFWVFLSK